MKFVSDKLQKNIKRVNKIRKYKAKRNSKKIKRAICRKIKKMINAGEKNDSLYIYRFVNDDSGKIESKTMAMAMIHSIYGDVTVSTGYPDSNYIEIRIEKKEKEVI